MNLTLRLIQRSGSGREIRLKKGTFAIGRSGECYLRVRSDLISRKHCEIRVTDTSVVIEDLGSKNGTFVNHERINEVRQLKTGDLLEVGSLRMEVVYVPATAPSAERPRAAPPPAQPTSSEEDDISQWLDDTSISNVASRDTDVVADDDTRQVRFTRPADDETTTDSTLAGSGGSSDESRGGKKGKKQPGKLPPIPQEKTKDSSEAAQDILRQMQQRR